jgi:flagellar protein FlaG
MVDPISNASVPREIGTAQSRPQDSPASPSAANRATDLPPDQRLLALQATVEKLLKKALPGNSKLQIVRDKDTGSFIYRSVDPETGDVIAQYPSEQIIKLRSHMRDMEGMLVDTHA